MDIYELIYYSTHSVVVGGRGVYCLHSVRPSRISFPLCSAYSFGWIPLMLIHIIKQLQKACRDQNFLQNFKIGFFGIFFLICNFDFVLSWLGGWGWGVGGGGWGGVWGGFEVSCGGHHRPSGKTTTGSALDGAVFDIAQILAYLVHNMSRSQLYLVFWPFWLTLFFFRSITFWRAYG